ncbi:hypothetical protein Fmac_030121 [Flemingia macrophylla]|uniref:Uncharacterized protein n=1 Tax=Flemingia macrophylla TaxID=520843 RepID=A0ABD1LCA6_9FABA
MVIWSEDKGDPNPQAIAKMILGLQYILEDASKEKKGSEDAEEFAKEVDCDAEDSEDVEDAEDCEDDEDGEYEDVDEGLQEEGVDEEEEDVENNEDEQNDEEDEENEEEEGSEDDAD